MKQNVRPKVILLLPDQILLEHVSHNVFLTHSHTHKYDYPSIDILYGTATLTQNDSLKHTVDPHGKQPVYIKYPVNGRE